MIYRKGVVSRVELLSLIAFQICLLSQLTFEHFLYYYTYFSTCSLLLLFFNLDFVICVSSCSFHIQYDVFKINTKFKSDQSLKPCLVILYNDKVGL